MKDEDFDALAVLTSHIQARCGCDAGSATIAAATLLRTKMMIKAMLQNATFAVDEGYARAEADRASQNITDEEFSHVHGQGGASASISPPANTPKEQENSRGGAPASE